MALLRRSVRHRPVYVRDRFHARRQAELARAKTRQEVDRYLYHLR